jgi:hypothetical protein
MFAIVQTLDGMEPIAKLLSVSILVSMDSVLDPILVNVLLILEELIVKLLSALLLVKTLDFANLELEETTTSAIAPQLLDGRVLIVIKLNVQFPVNMAEDALVQINAIAEELDMQEPNVQLKLMNAMEHQDPVLVFLPAQIPLEITLALLAHQATMELDTEQMDVLI